MPTDNEKMKRYNEKMKEIDEMFNSFIIIF
jgi:hypothetical protein